ncbi:IS21-like element helper ATPase IstB [Clostridium sediminicola]|uniref:IS21-like element helper ATPase IstB n=1 Tax=Clostridium sediminicola TaxID=3114879 RepID=UPI0031F20353
MKLGVEKDNMKTIEEYANFLKLSGLKSKIEDAINEANTCELSYESFLLNLLQSEYDRRVENGKKNRIRIAKFPYKKYLDDLVVSDLPDDAQKKIKMLSTLQFIEDGQNVILAGNPGTGKTHIAIGLGINACLEGYKVLYTTVPLFINQLKECRSSRTLRAYENKFEKYDLVILDELGYISSDKEGAELLFTNLSLRTGRKSTIVTTNLSFDRRGEVFIDPIMTAAITDRLTYKSYMINMNGTSYRMKETKEWLERIN